MFDLKGLNKAIQQIAEEKKIDPEKVVEAVEESIATAYKREYDKKGEIIKAKADLKTGELKFWQVKTVVDDTTVDVENVVSEEDSEMPEELDDQIGDKLPRYNPAKHILLAEAVVIQPGIKLGEELITHLEPREDFGRIAAQSAKQVIIQKIREAERASILQEFSDKVDEIVSGIVQRYDRGNVYIDLGRAIGVMYRENCIPGERYNAGDRLRFYVAAVDTEGRGAGVLLSRAHPKFVSKLFALEVPEIADGIVEIKAIAREPGSRTKFAVSSSDQNIDPIGACVGQRGTRVMAVGNELGQEKLDIIEWSEDPAVFISNSLSPAEVDSVEILPRHEAKAYVNENQLSLAIGRGGQNVRLAARITGWKIDVRSASKPEDVQEGGVADNEPEANPERASV